ncbi:unnamed protein product, partial [Phaeothamnion confervicola]
GRTGLFLDERGRPLEDQYAYLLRMERCSKDSLVEFMAQVGSVDEDDKPAGPRARQVEVVEYFPESDLELQTLMMRCATLRALRDQITAQQALSHDESVVFRFTVGHMESGPQAVNHYLAMCPEIPESARMGGKFRSNPMSCARIRERIPHITARVMCDCALSGHSTYPNPLLHLQSLPAPDELDAAQMRALAEDYAAALKELDEVQQRLSRFGDVLVRCFEREKLSELATTRGLLKLD